MCVSPLLFVSMWGTFGLTNILALLVFSFHCSTSSGGALHSLLTTYRVRYALTRRRCRDVSTSPPGHHRHLQPGPDHDHDNHHHPRRTTGPGNPPSTSGARTAPTTRGPTAITRPGARTGTNTAAPMTRPRPPHRHRHPRPVRVRPSSSCSHPTH